MHHEVVSVPRNVVAGERLLGWALENLSEFGELAPVAGADQAGADRFGLASPVSARQE